MKTLKMIVLLIVIFFLGNTIYVESLELEGKIHKNVYIENVDYSGLTKKEARIKLEETIENNNELKLLYEDKIYQIKLSDLNICYKVQEMIDEAYSIGRGKSIVSNIKTRLKLNMGETYVIKLKYTHDNKNIDNYISYLQKEIDRDPVNATVKVENDSIVLQKETYGIKVDPSKLKDILINKAKQLVCEKDNIPTISIKPIHVYEELSKIDTVLGRFETHFNKNKVGRVNNICVAAEATNNILINPYEEFSFNNCTSSKDFISRLRKAPVIKNGKVEEGLGGGICQVSTTIYNAALYAGLEITNVRNHSIPSSYIEKGRDATVSSGNLDLRFKNNFNTPILIYNKVCDDKIISVIYGCKNDKKDIEVVTELVKTIPKKTKYINSDNLYVGESEVQKKGRVGYKVNTFRVFKGQGEPVKEFISESYYPSIVEEVLQGTKIKKIQPKLPNTNEHNNDLNNKNGIENPNGANDPSKINNIDNLNTEVL